MLDGVPFSAGLKKLYRRHGPHISVTLICLLFIASLWGGLFMQLDTERERIIQSKIQENDNLARVFGEHVARTIRAAEITLREIASEYQRYGRKFDLVQYAKNRSIYLDPYIGLSIIDEKGDRILGGTPLPPETVNLSKTPDYHHHAQHDAAGLFISAPRRGAITGKWTIFFSIRINNANGAFAGYANVGMDPSYFSRIYSELDLGKDSVVALVGRDGIIRVRSVGTDVTAGQNVSGAELFRQLAAADRGSYISPAVIDQVIRLFSYRALKDYPLAVVVGQSQAVALADYERRRSAHQLAAGAITAVILCLGLFALLQIARAARESEARRRSELQLNEAQRIAQIGSWELDLATNKFTWSDEIFRIFEIDQSKFGATYEAFLNAIHPEDREAVNNAYTGSLKTREPYQITHRLLMTDGRIKYVHERCESEFDAEGKPLKSMGTVQDITDLKHAEQQARRLSNIVEGSLNEIYVFDANSLNFIMVNQGARTNLGYTTEELRKLTPVDLKPEHTPESFATLVAPLRTGAQHLIQFSTVHRRKDGSIYPVEVHLQMFSDESPPVFVAVIIDITERRRAEIALNELNRDLEQRVRERTAALESANKELEAFNYSVAHDLRSPLRAIDGYSQLLLTEQASRLDDEGRGFLQNIMHATRHMGQLIDDLLAYSRLERRDMQIKPVDPRALIESLLAERDDEIKARGMAVTVTVPSSPVTADREGLAMALRNLLENALKFTRDVPQPVIEIGGRDTATTRILSVRDNGIGFDMEYRDKIFGIFQRLHRSEDYPGTGVGLAIVKKAMERMGGRVWAESAPGKGATFYLEIPK